MRNFEELSAGIEQLEKEIWHLGKFSLPSLKKEIEDLIASSSPSETVISNIVKKIIDNVLSTSSTINEIKAEIDDLISSQQTLEENVATATTNINKLEERYSNILSSLANLGKEILKNKDDIAALKLAVQSIQGDISKINPKLDEITDTQNNLSTQVTTLNENVSTLQDRYSNVLSSLANLGERILANQNKIEELEQNLNKPAPCDLIYDKDDASLNNGLNEGIYGGKYVIIDFAKYSKIRIYAALKGVDTIYEMYVKGLTSLDHTLSATNRTLTEIYRLNINAAASTKKLTVLYSSCVKHLANNAIEFTRALVEKTYIIKKIEGIY